MYIYGILTSEVEEVDEVKLRRYFAASIENLSDDLDTCKEINYTGYALFSECPTTFQKKKCHELFYRNNEEWRIYKKNYQEYNYYMVSNYGRVQHFIYGKFRYMLPIIKRGTRIRVVKLSNNYSSNISVTKLIGICFLGELEEGYYYTKKNHLIKEDNLSNVEKITKKEHHKRCGRLRRKAVEVIHVETGVRNEYSSVTEAAAKEYMHQSNLSKYLIDGSGDSAGIKVKFIK